MLFKTVLLLRGRIVSFATIGKTTGMTPAVALGKVTPVTVELLKVVLVRVVFPMVLSVVMLLIVELLLITATP